MKKKPIIDDLNKLAESINRLKCWVHWKELDLKRSTAEHYEIIEEEQLFLSDIKLLLSYVINDEEKA